MMNSSGNHQLVCASWEAPDRIKGLMLLLMQCSGDRQLTRSSREAPDLIAVVAADDATQGQSPVDMLLMETPAWIAMFGAAADAI